MTIDHIITSFLSGDVFADITIDRGMQVTLQDLTEAELEQLADACVSALTELREVRRANKGGKR